MRQRLRHRILGLLSLVLLTPTSGCMSYLAHVGGPSGLEGPPPPYAATKLDLEFVTAPLWVDEGEDRFNIATGLMMFLGMIDFPFTALSDTACLPVDLVTMMKAGNNEDPSSKRTPDEGVATVGKGLP